MSGNKLSLNWSAVEKALAEGTFSGYKIGVLETEKLLSDFLEQKKIPGRNNETKIKYVRNFLSRAEQLKYGREIYKKIIEQPHFEISQEETKQTISGYWQAMLDLEEAIATLTLFQKMTLKFKYWLGQLLKKIRLVALFFAILILIILFLYETSAGQKIAIALGKGVHYLIFIVGPWILGAISAISIIWIGLKLLRKRREF